jgi:hypothetical protein
MVGEGIAPHPSADEGLNGGALLDKALADASIDLAKAYVTNVVKHFNCEASFPLTKSRGNLVEHSWVPQVGLASHFLRSGARFQAAGLARCAFWRNACSNLEHVGGILAALWMV